ncbi:hypothetical protein N7535_000695 [Penicillium sp. DV-2018c]|nr:hypothetical protein N7535_000695 [Penicillium sp. DV-2018c]
MNRQILSLYTVYWVWLPKHISLRWAAQDISDSITLGLKGEDEKVQDEKVQDEDGQDENGQDEKLQDGKDGKVQDEDGQDEKGKSEEKKKKEGRTRDL